MTPPLNEFDRDLIALVERCCTHARELAAQPGGLPEEEVRTLARGEYGYLVAVTVHEIDWHGLSAKLTDAPGIWDEVKEVRERAIAAGHLVPGDEHPALDPNHPLWDLLVMPMLKHYFAQKSDWEWDAELADRSATEWKNTRGDGAYRTIAPLFHFDGPDEAIAIEDDLIIRPFTDADRDAIWRGTGVAHIAQPFSPRDLEEWSHVVDYKWKRMGLAVGLDHQPGVDDVTDVVRAVRLLQPHITGTKFIWSRPDPPDNPSGSFVQALLSIPGNTDLHHEPAAKISSSDRETLGELLHRVRAARQDQRLTLALRRFDLAYERDGADGEEDSLIDLWIAFEALLLPDGQSELSYRAALRIAQLIGGKADERRETFKQARLSYKCRSQIVHGEEVKADLYEMVEETRELARKALRAWVLEPPPGGIEDVDHSLFR